MFWLYQFLVIAYLLVLSRHLNLNSQHRSIFLCIQFSRHFLTTDEALIAKTSGEGGAGGGACWPTEPVPIRKQRTANLNLNSVFAILKLITLLTMFDQKITLSNVVNYKTYSFTTAVFVCCTN